MPDPTGRISHLPEMHRGVSWKQPCRVATTANITIATALNAGDTIDGVTLAAGDRVLVKDQSTGSQNGIYLAGVTPIRDFDMDQDAATSVPASEVMGAFVYVIAGTVNGGTLWRNTNTTAPTLGTTALTFSQATISSIAASAVTVLDSAGYFTGTNVETVLAELGALVEGVTAHGNTGATETFAATTGVHTATRDASSTYTFTALASGLASGMVLILTPGTPGPYTVTWPGSVVWPGGVAPTLSDTPGAVDVFTFLSVDGGTVWFGFATGGGSALTIKDEGSSLATAATSIDFVGAGVVASGTTAAKTVTIAGVTEANVQAVGHYEILMASGSADPLLTSDGLDYLYVWVT